MAGGQVLLIKNGAGSRTVNGSASTSATASAASSSGPPSSSSSPITVVGVAAPPPTPTAAPSVGRGLSRLAHSARLRLGLRLPSLTELHVIYLGIMLAFMLALFSVFLLHRILDIEAKTSLYRTPVDFNMVSPFLNSRRFPSSNIHFFVNSGRATMKTSLRRRCAGKRSCRTEARQKLSIF